MRASASRRAYRSWYCSRSAKAPDCIISTTSAGSFPGETFIADPALRKKLGRSRCLIDAARFTASCAPLPEPGGRSASRAPTRQVCRLQPGDLNSNFRFRFYRMPVDPPAVLRWRRAGQHRSRTLADLFAGIRAIVAYPDEYLDGFVERMSEANVAHIPVISREDGDSSDTSPGRT